MKSSLPGSTSNGLDIETVFAERARRLAQPVSTTLSSSRRHALILGVGGEQYAIEAEHLVSVVPKAACAKVPGSAPEVAGLLAFRSRVVPVVDLALLLGLKPGPQTSLRAVLIVRGARAGVGLAVGAINEMLELPTGPVESLEQSPEGPAKFVRKLADGLPWLIRMNILLSHPVMKGLFQ